MKLKKTSTLGEGREEGFNNQTYKDDIEQRINKI